MVDCMDLKVTQTLCIGPLGRILPLGLCSLAFISLITVPHRFRPPIDFGNKYNGSSALPSICACDCHAISMIAASSFDCHILTHSGLEIKCPSGAPSMLVF